MSSYNLAVMNFIGLGTYKSCQLSMTFFKHVVSVGEQSQLLKKAYRMMQSGQVLQGTMLYMELAEMGFGVAALNLALILERADVFTTENFALGELGLRQFNHNFNLNKQLAMKYLQFASHSQETESEASLKIAEFFYHGTSGHRNLKDALKIYKQVEDTSTVHDIKGHALFQLGVIYQFGEGVPIDNEVAQIYYDKALETKMNEKVPIYLMNFYNRW